MLAGISIGHNERIAFGLTIFSIDQEDLMASTLAGAGLSVLLIHAGDVSQIQALLLAFPDLDVVDALDGGSITPTRSNRTSAMVSPKLPQ